MIAAVPDPSPFPARVVWPCTHGRPVYLARDAAGRLHESTDPAELSRLVRRINQRQAAQSEGREP